MKRAYILQGWIHTISTLLLVLYGTIAYALDPHKRLTQYTLDQWTRASGLPASSISQIYQTRDGTLWIGTSVGLFRYDGMSFEPLSTDPYNEKNTESITSLCEASDGTLWIGTAYGGIRHFKDGRMKIYGTEVGFVEPAIRLIWEGKDSTVWIGTGNGLFAIKNNTLISFTFEANYITALAQTSDGTLWVGTHRGLSIVENKQPWKTSELNISGGLPNSIITTLFCDSKGRMWIGTANGLLVWEKGKTTYYSVNNGLSDYSITVITEDRDGAIWVGTDHGGTNRYVNNEWSHYTISDGLTSNRILSIYEDKEGSLWIGTAEGLNRLKNGNVVTLTTREGLYSNFVTSIVEGTDKSMYFFYNTSGAIQRIQNGISTVFSGLLVGAAYRAFDGSIWTATSGCLTRLHGNTVTVYDTTKGIPYKWISALCEDNESLILYIDDRGVFRFRNGKLAPFTLENSTTTPFSTTYVTCMYYQKDSATLWVGTTDGVARIRQKKLTMFTVQNGLADNWISSIADDGKGTFWFTSPKKGLTRYQNGTFTRYTIEEGLFTNELYCVLCDEKGDIWLSSPSGIGYLRQEDIKQFETHQRDKLSMRVFTSADGMKSEECFGGSWQPLGWKASDGKIWFATVKGAVYLDPGNLQFNTIPPQVNIVRLSSDGKNYFAQRELLRLPAGTKEIEVYYTATSYLVPERVLFKYRLDGYDTTWVDAKTRRHAFYTNLSPGEYTFHVIACNNDGVWNKEGASVRFEIEPYFYQTRWFFFLISLCVLGIFYGVYRWRVWGLKRREEELQRRVQEELANVKMLSGLIPICSSCKKIRNDKGYWDQLESYIQTHSEAKFSHGICPECAAKLYGDYYPKTEEKKERTS